MAAIVFVTYAAIVWMLRRGFDWTDETFVYNLVVNNRELPGEPWGFQHLLHPLYILTGQSVLAMRIVRLAGYVMVSAALVWSARAVMRRIGFSIPRSGWVFILLLAQAGTFYAWSYPPQYLGYNEVASWFTQLGVALILLSLAWGASTAGDQGRSRLLWSVWAGLGGVLTVLMFAKVTSGLAFGALLAITVVIPNPGLRLWKRVVAAVAGIAAVLLVLWLSRCPIGFYFTNMASLLFDKSARAGVGRPLSEMVGVYTLSVSTTGRALLPALLIFALLAGTFSQTARSNADRARGRALDGIAWILGVLLVIALITLPRTGVWPHLGMLIAFMGAAGIIGLVVLGPYRVTMQGSPASRWLSVAIGGFALVAAPFISSVGTSIPIVQENVFSATIWAVVLGIALVLLAQQGALLQSSARNVPALIGCVVVVLAALSVKAYIAHPYRNAPLLSQQTSTSVPALRGLLLTRSDAAWIDWVYAAGRSLGAEQVPATAIDASGALFAFNHSGYANPWVGRKYPAAFKSLTLACATHKPSDLFVLQPGNSPMGARSTRGVIKSLAACGISFPGDFQVVDERLSPNPLQSTTIWRLKSGVLATQGQKQVR